MTRKPQIPITEKSVYTAPAKYDWDSNGDFSNIIVQFLLVPIVFPYRFIKRLFNCQ